MEDCLAVTNYSICVKQISPILSESKIIGSFDLKGQVFKPIKDSVDTRNLI